MDYKIVWSPEAVEDLESIASYIARDSSFYAGAVVEKILNTANDIGEFPFTGRIVPEIGQKNIRERLVYSYRVIYRIQKNIITIAAVIHGRRLIAPFEERITNT
jgi:addiction module RelE/StbE family toxin